MNGNESKLYEALAKIAAAANEALGECECGEGHGQEEEGGEAGEPPSCTPKALPGRLLVKAAEVASKINPVNAPGFAVFALAGEGFQVMEPARIAVLTSKYWGAKPRRLTVSFMESTPANLRNRIISHMNAWTKTGAVSFA